MAMSHVIKAAVLLLLFGVTGCAGKKPLNYQFTSCKVVNTYVDGEGHERRDCNCRNGKQIGWDVKKRLAIIRCE